MVAGSRWLAKGKQWWPAGNQVDLVTAGGQWLVALMVGNWWPMGGGWRQWLSQWQRSSSCRFFCGGEGGELQHRGVKRDKDGRGKCKDFLKTVYVF